MLSISKIHFWDWHIFNISVFLWSILVTSAMIELGFVNKKSDHFSYIAVFGKHELQLSQKRCFHVKEQGLSFSKHPKILKSVHYS